MRTKSDLALRTAFASMLAVAGGVGGAAAAQAQSWSVDASTRQADTILVSANDTQILEVPGGAAKVFVANPAVADVEALDPRRILVLGRKRGSSTIIVVTRYGAELKYNIVVGRPLAQLRNGLAMQFPASALIVHDAPTGLTVTGSIENAGEAEKARKYISQFLEEGETLNFDVRVTAGSQVNLHVRVIEVARDASKSLGFNLSSLITSGSSQIGILTGRAPLVGTSVAPVAGLSAGATFPNGEAVFNRASSGASSLGYRYASGGDVLGGVIDAMAARNLLKVLAEPNLTAASGQAANFLAGGQIPVPIARGTGDVAQVTVEWKDFGIGLKFTPTILDPGNISIKVNSEVSELSDIGSARLGGYLIPSISTRRVETTVNLAAGQSFAIAGLFNERSSRSLEQFPGLGSIPIIGELFRSRAFRSSKTELIVIVTPFLSAPADSIDEIAVPEDAPRGRSPLLSPSGPAAPKSSDAGGNDAPQRNADADDELPPLDRNAAGDPGLQDAEQVEHDQ